ncbi:hypothetical protein GCM10010317_059280 [Streptomyces mirabilis]|nr:hypothetical protein GCM10010317_059280 [Streptomyces mirabilis]
MLVGQEHGSERAARSPDSVSGTTGAYHWRTHRRCSDMDSTHTAQRRRPEQGLVGRPYAELTDGRLGHPPIYAQLPAEWRVKGRVVPEHREVVAVLWASFAASSPFESAAWPVDSWAERRNEKTAGPVPAEPGTVSAGSVPAVPAVPVPRGLLGW